MPKKKGTNQELEKISRNKLDNCFSGWVVNELKDEDYGLDFKVRFTEPPSDFPNASGVKSDSKGNSGQNYRDVMPVHFFVQLKSTEGQFEGEQ